MNRYISHFAQRTRTRVLRVVIRYLAQPVNTFDTITNSDRHALASVLHRGDVLLSEGNTRAAALVKRVTHSEWSHVSMYVGPLTEAADPLCIVEADIAGGVRTIPLSQLDARRVCVLRPIKLNDPERQRLIESILRFVGSEYDVGLAWMLACNLLVQRWRARLGTVPTTMGRGATGFICSSLIAQAFALIGYSILPIESDDRRIDAPHHSCPIPADFEHAAAFEIVWCARRGDETDRSLQKNLNVSVQ
jgi:hypothetical protein